MISLIIQEIVHSYASADTLPAQGGNESGCKMVITMLAGAGMQMQVQHQHQHDTPAVGCGTGLGPTAHMPPHARASAAEAEPGVYTLQPLRHPSLLPGAAQTLSHMHAHPAVPAGRGHIHSPDPLTLPVIDISAEQGPGIWLLCAGQDQRADRRLCPTAPPDLQPLAAVSDLLWALMGVHSPGSGGILRDAEMPGATAAHWNHSVLQMGRTAGWFHMTGCLPGHRRHAAHTPAWQESCYMQLAEAIVQQQQVHCQLQRALFGAPLNDHHPMLERDPFFDEQSH